MIRYLLDTDCAIYLLAGDNALLRTRVEACAPGEIALSTISLAEIGLGIRLGKGPPADKLAALLKIMAPLPFDERAARAYGRLPFKRARFDRFIAAHALSLNVGIVTNNDADFADVPDLIVENWSQ